MPASFARIDLAAITDNVAAIAASTSAAVMAVVKADGYGHGAVSAARAALAGGASWLAVAFVDEALALRHAGIRAPLLALITRSGDDLDAAVAAGIDLGVGSLECLRAVAGRGARVHLEVDTGLSRGGARTEIWSKFFAAARDLDVVAVWSHFACSDEPGHPANARQLAAYHDALHVAKHHGITPSIRHLANSGATLTLPESHVDVVRPGIAIYGLSPGPGCERAVRDLGLRPAMTLRSEVGSVKRIPAGSGVSYGWAFTAAHATALALVPLGYADGIPRHAANSAQVAIAGRRFRIAGAVCMDQFMVELHDAPVGPGEEVLLFGPGTHGEPSASEWAAAAGTIGYEIVTRIGARVPRVYCRDGAAA